MRLARKMVRASTVKIMVFLPSLIFLRGLFLRTFRVLVISE